MPALATEEPEHELTPPVRVGAQAVKPQFLRQPRRMEYVGRAGDVTYDRVDDILSLILDKDTLEVVGARILLPSPPPAEDSIRSRILDFLGDGPRATAEVARAIGYKSKYAARDLIGLAADGLAVRVDGGGPRAKARYALKKMVQP